MSIGKSFAKISLILVSICLWSSPSASDDCFVNDTCSLIKTPLRAADIEVSVVFVEKEKQWVKVEFIAACGVEGGYFKVGTGWISWIGIGEGRDKVGKRATDRFLGAKILDCLKRTGVQPLDVYIAVCPRDVSDGPGGCKPMNSIREWRWIGSEDSTENIVSYSVYGNYNAVGIFDKEDATIVIHLVRRLEEVGPGRDCGLLGCPPF